MIPNGRVRSLILIAAVGVTAGCDSGIEGVAGLNDGGPFCVVPEDHDELIERAITLINIERARIGATRLELTAEVTAWAADYACRMIEGGFFGHVDPATRENFDHRARKSRFCCQAGGENLARGYDSAEQLVIDWLFSDSHCQNLLDDAYRQVGLGVRRDSESDQLYWALVLLAPAEAGCNCE